MESLKEVNSQTDLTEYLMRKAQNHISYKHYTTYETLNKIFEEPYFRFTSIGYLNDISERYYIEDKISPYVYDYFVGCFSYSRDENVAMWMLYGGKGKSGICLDFQQKHIKQMLTNQLFLKYENKFIEIPKSYYDISLSDVIYYSEKEENFNYIYYVKRGDEALKLWRHKLNTSAHYVKNMAWAYEHECRIIIRMNLDKLCNLVPGTIEYIYLPIDEILKDLKESKRIILSPNFEERVEKDFYKESDLGHLIDWDLCKGCKKNVLHQTLPPNPSNLRP